MFNDLPDSRVAVRYWLLSALALAVLIGYWAATIVNVSEPLLNLAFTVVIVSVLPVALWSVFRAPAELRRFVAIVVASFFFQVLGSVLWYVAYLGDHGKLPHLGYWTPFIYAAILLSLAGVWAGMRRILRPRDALLDYSILVAAAASVAILTTEHHGSIAINWSPAAIDAIVRPLLSLLVLVLLASAALGRWQSLPMPVGLVGIALLFDASGLLLQSYFLAEGTYRTDRWTNALWMNGLIAAFLAALVLIARLDRPIRLSREPLPGVSPTPLLVVTGTAWGVSGAVALYGYLSGEHLALSAGLAGIGWIGMAAVLRMVGALRETRTAYSRLDETHFALEQAQDRNDRLLSERERIITELEQRNVELTAIQTMLGPLLDLADQRTDGLLRSNLEETAHDLADWLPLRSRD